MKSLRTGNAKSSLGFAKVVRNRYPIVFEMDDGASPSDNLTSLVKSNNYHLPALSGRDEFKHLEPMNGLPSYTQS